VQPELVDTGKLQLELEAPAVRRLGAAVDQGAGPYHGAEQSEVTVALQKVDQDFSRPRDRAAARIAAGTGLPARRPAREAVEPTCCRQEQPSPAALETLAIAAYMQRHQGRDRGIRGVTPTR